MMNVIKWRWYHSLLALLLLAGCNKQEFSDGFAQWIEPQFKTGTATLRDDGRNVEALAGVFCVNEEFLNCLASAVIRYPDDEPYYIYSINIAEINTLLIGDTVLVTEQCYSEPCPRDTLPYASILLYASDLFHADYNIDLAERNWLVVEGWDISERRLRMSFDLHFRRVAVLDGWQNMTPLNINLSEGYLDATVYQE